jgi:Mg-chelatase subunit ChlD
MDWATKRKLQYTAIIIAFLIVTVAVPFYMFIYRAPTCFDNIRNGDEAGVDCGGSCRLLCTGDSVLPVQRWDPRVFKVSPGMYSAVAYLENPNVSAEARQASYTFRFFDAEGKQVAERTGTTFIPRGKTFAVFEGGIQLSDENPPRRAIFAFNEPVIWTRTTAQDPDLTVTNKALTREETAPRVDASVTNNTLDRVENIEFVAVVFDGAGNAIAASKTFVPSLERGESKGIVFTWPQPFETKSFVCESPADIALVIDRSGSMEFLGKNPPQPLTDVKNAAVFFVNQLQKNDRAAVVSFANDASNPIDTVLTDDFRSVISAIDRIAIATSTVQNTNFADGIKAARTELASLRGRPGIGKYLIALTDGVATRPVRAGDEAYPEKAGRAEAEAARAQGISVFTIGLGKDINAEFLKAAASSTEDAFFAPTARDLQGIYQEIATRICKRQPASIEIFPRIYPAGLGPDL